MNVQKPAPKGRKSESGLDQLHGSEYSAAPIQQVWTPLPDPAGTQVALGRPSLGCEAFAIVEIDQPTSSNAWRCLRKRWRTRRKRWSLKN